MKELKRILNIRKQSRIAHSNENFWFFGEDSTDSQSNTAKRKSARNDRIRIFKDDFSRYSLDDSNKDKSKKESPFIVDWQMSDAF